MKTRAQIFSAFAAALAALAFLALPAAAPAVEGYAVFMDGSRYEGNITRCNNSGNITLWSPVRKRYDTYGLDEIYKIIVLYKSYQELDICPEDQKNSCPDYWMWSNKEPGRIVVVLKDKKGKEGEKHYYEFIKGDGCFLDKTVAETQSMGDYKLTVRFFIAPAAYIEDQEHFDWMKHKLINEIYLVPAPPKPKKEPETAELGGFEPPAAPIAPGEPLPLPENFSGSEADDRGQEAEPASDLNFEIQDSEEHAPSQGKSGGDENKSAKDGTPDYPIPDNIEGFFK